MGKLMKVDECLDNLSVIRIRALTSSNKKHTKECRSANKNYMCCLSNWNKVIYRANVKEHEISAIYIFFLFFNFELSLDAYV